MVVLSRPNLLLPKDCSSQRRQQQKSADTAELYVSLKLAMTALTTVIGRNTRQVVQQQNDLTDAFVDRDEFATNAEGYLFVRGHGFTAALRFSFLLRFIRSGWPQTGKPGLDIHKSHERHNHSQGTPDQRALQPEYRY
jgi:hypothetical protein